LVFRFANFVTTPAGHQRINGPILRVRASLVGAPTFSFRTGDITTLVDTGVSIGIGACWSPYYDTTGLVLLACADFGYAVMGFTTEEANGTLNSSKTAGFGTGGPLLEAEYNLGTLIHVGAKVGTDVVVGDFAAKRSDGTEVWKINSWSVYGTLGVGVHF
jgi:hypothetical protein